MYGRKMFQDMIKQILYKILKSTLLDMSKQNIIFNKGNPRICLLSIKWWFYISCLINNGKCWWQCSTLMKLIKE